MRNFCLFIEYFDLRLSSIRLLMFLGLGIRDRDQNCSTCWPLLQVGFKTLFIITIISTTVFLIFPTTGKYFPNDVKLVVQKGQAWRIITSFLYHGSTLKIILAVLFNLLILYISLPDIEKSYSTAYITFQIFIQVLLGNIFVIVLGYPFVYFQWVKSVSANGLIPLNLTFMCIRSSKTPEEPTKFCWFPCLIKMKFVPLCYTLLQLAFQYPPIPLLIYFSLAYVQFMVRGRSFIQLPLSAYNKFDALMPEGIKNSMGYIKVVRVQQSLRSICLSHGCCGDNEQEEIGRDRVQIIGGGVSIGSNSKSQPANQEDIKQYWEKKSQQMLKQQIPQKNNQRQKKQVQQTPQDPFEGALQDLDLGDDLDVDGKNIVADLPLIEANKQSK